MVKKDLWAMVAAGIEESEDFTQMKWKGLVSSYKRIKADVSKSQVTGSGVADVVKTKWFAFEAMQFLNDTNKPRRTITSLPDDDEPAQSDKSQPPYMEEEWLDLNEDVPIQDVRPWVGEANQPKSNSRKRKRETQLDEVETQIVELIGSMKKKLEADADADKKGNAAIGTYVTARLNELTDRKRNKAVTQICQILATIAEESDN